KSKNFRASPLLGPGSMANDPMGSQFLKQFELDPDVLADPDPDVIVDLSRRTFNVFYIKDAVGSEYIPHQDDFVIPFGIKSNVDIVGVLPSGTLFFLMLFLRVPLPREVAEIFKPLTLSIKVALLPFDGNSVFAGGARPVERVIATMDDAQAVILRL